MLDTFHSFNARDFQRRYSGSYGFFTVPETKKKVLVYLNNVNERTVEFVDANQIAYTAIADTGVEFEFIPITRKLFVYNDRLHYIRRKLAKQWARGVNTQNTALTIIGGRTQSLSFGNINAAFFDKKADVLQTCNLLEQKKAECVALSDTFGVVDSTLYVYDDVIGSFMADRREILLEDDLFRQEVLDLVARLGLPYKVSHGK